MPQFMKHKQQSTQPQRIFFVGKEFKAKLEKVVSFVCRVHSNSRCCHQLSTLSNRSLSIFTSYPKLTKFKPLLLG